MTNAEISRYSRQLILPAVGAPVQAKLLSRSALVVGAGGLGAPVCLYLAAAGVGRIGIVDGDNVELNNLHRQVIHTEATVGMPKAESARLACLRLNSSLEVHAYVTRFDSSNAMQIAKDYDLLIDASDNLPTRYLINDVAVILKKPLVSGSALQMEGQATVYAYKGGPCYRCLFPTPPPAETVQNCSDAGVLGVVTGVIGCVQALEVIKILGEMSADVLSQKLLLFDASTNRYMAVKLRPRDPACAVCGDTPTIRSPVDYVQFCGAPMHDRPVDPNTSANVAPTHASTPSRASTSPLYDAYVSRHPIPSLDVKQYATIRASGRPHVLLDVREPVQYAICSLPGSINLPMRQLPKRLDEVIALLRGSDDNNTPRPSVYVICRRGIDSTTSTRFLYRALADSAVPIPADQITNVAGGLTAWHQHVDPEFPLY